MSPDHIRVKRICAALLVGGLVAAPIPSARARDGPAGSLLLFVASWCVPCRGEIARLAEISAAALPRETLVVPLDGGPQTAAMLKTVPASQLRLEDRDRAAVAPLLKGTSGLPFSVMIGADGRQCAEHRAPLDAAAVRAMTARCGEPR